MCEILSLLEQSVFCPSSPVPYSIPAEEFETPNGEPPTCHTCNTRIDEHVYPDGQFNPYCEGCIDKLLKSIEPKAEKYARDKCKITDTITRFEPEYEFRCTPEEYARGEKMSYTPNSHLAGCRHSCTNYDALIKPLDKYNVEDWVYYSAIRYQINHLLYEEFSRLEDARDEELDLELEAEQDDELQQL